MSKPLLTCPWCKTPNFTERGLRAHRCPATGRKPLGPHAIRLAQKSAERIPVPTQVSMPKSNNALALLSHPEFAVKKDGLAKLSEVAVAQVAAVGELESKAAIGAVVAGLTLHRVKASVPHGKFGDWQAKHLTKIHGWSKATAAKNVSYYMRLSQIFVEKTKIERPALLALPGDQLALDVGDSHQAKEFFTKVSKFVGGISLTDLLIKHGIRSVGLKKELANDDDAPAPGAAEDYFAQVAERIYGFRQIVANRESLLRLTPQQLDTLKAEVTDTYSTFTRLYEEARGKATAVTV